MSKKPQYSAHDRLTAHLVLIVIFGLVIMGALALYMTGVFAPAKSTDALADTEPLNLPTQPPVKGLADWLFASAAAEEAPAQGEGEAGGLDQLLQNLLDEEGEYEITAADVVAVTDDDLFTNQNLPTDWTNIMLMATDGRDHTTKNGRTDVMIIASVNETTGEIKLSSLARDMYVQIPNGVGGNRINSAYAYGGGGKTGARLALKTVNQVFEMNVKYYVVVNFADMVALVDSLGGVDILLVGEEYKYINENVAVSEDYEGFPKNAARRTLTQADVDTVVHLDGLQALGYARIRKMDNDLQRGSRQRILLQAMIDKIMSNLTVQTIYSVAMSMMPNTDTNFPILEGIRIGTGFLQAEDISYTEFALPIAGSYSAKDETDRDGRTMNVISFARGQNVEALHEFIYGEYIPASAE